MSSNVFMDVLKSRLPVIQNIQEDALAIINKALQFIAEDSGRSELVELGLFFKSPFQEILEQMKEDENTNQPRGGGEVLPGQQ